MAERRSLHDAMEMTPEKLAFISGEHPNHPTPLVQATPLTPSTISFPTQPGASQSPDVRRRRPPRQRERHPSEEDHTVTERVLSQLLVPLTTRLQHRTAEALRRASLELRLAHATPASQQEIVETAINAWLTDRGYL